MAENQTTADLPPEIIRLATAWLIHQHGMMAAEANCVMAGNPTRQRQEAIDVAGVVVSQIGAAHGRVPANYLPRVLRQWANEFRANDALAFDLQLAADEIERLCATASPRSVPSGSSR